MRCARCGAHNSAGAAWCTQCYAATTQEAPTPAGPGQSPPEATGAVGGAADQAPPEGRARAAPAAGAHWGPQVTGGAVADDPGGSAGARGSGDRAVREVDGLVEWRCSTCGTWVALEQPLCSTCGSPRTGFGTPGTGGAGAVDVPEATLMGTSVILPGLGHVLAGRVGSGSTRIMLWALWAGGGLWWALTAGSGRGPGLLLLLGAAVLWAATLVDVRAIARGQGSEPFGVRGLLWMVVGVTGLLMLMVAFVAAGSLEA